MEQLKEWDRKSWQNFKASYSIDDLETRFKLEEEWIKAGKKISGKEFHTELKKRLEDRNV